jgi:hypothetical protein
MATDGGRWICRMTVTTVQMTVTGRLNETRCWLPTPSRQVLEAE